jgi:tetratricopeptide (TPR) repeat protein
MGDSIQTELHDVESEMVGLPGGGGIGRQVTPPGHAAEWQERFEQLMEHPAPPGYMAFITRHNGGELSKGARILLFEESVKRVEDVTEGDGSLRSRGLWPVLERGDRLFALDTRAAGDAEFPVVEVSDRSVHRMGTTFLSFMRALMSGLMLDDGADPVVVGRELVKRDPGLAAGWLDLADALEWAGKSEEVDAVLEEGMRVSRPPGPSLAFAVALRALDRGEDALAEATLKDVLALTPLDAHDEDTRLDAAAVWLLRAAERGDEAQVAQAREILGDAGASTAAYWRTEVMRALVHDQVRRAELAARVVQVLVPEDTDSAKMVTDPRPVAALKAVVEAQAAIEQGEIALAVSKAKEAVAHRSDLGITQLALAEALNAHGDRDAGIEAARRATECNPALVEGWRELGDAYLDARQVVEAEGAYRRAIACDGTYGFGMAKLAQALLEQGRRLEALDTINVAEQHNGDPFLLAAVRGDILTEMNRHSDAAEAYDQALRIKPEDHLVLHQAAVEHSRAGDDTRAADLFERALRHDQEGCHQTLVDYGDLLRRSGRIGDAVRCYRKAVAVNPREPEWRQLLREAERELLIAPN